MDDQAFQMLMARLNGMDEKIDDLLAWKWKVAGITMVLTVFGSMGFELILHYLK